MIIPPDTKKYWDELRSKIKRHITIEKRIPTQFIRLNNIKKTENREKRLNNPLILQIVSKMGGTPFVYQFSNILDNSIFIGIDRSRSWEDKPSVSCAASVFSNTGEFIYAGTTDLDSRLDDSIKNENLDRLIRDAIDNAIKEYPIIDKVFILRDSGRGKFRYLDEEAVLCLNICKEKNMDCIFVLCNKSAGWRIFEGDVNDEAYRADQYTAVTNFGKKNEFILQTTAPLNLRKTEDRESPRTTTYEIRVNSSEIPNEQLKELLARCIS
ncbi:MAG: Piwi domain-containing protein, partial [Candidatus Hodarchaeales archaeon]